MGKVIAIVTMLSMGFIATAPVQASAAAADKSSALEIPVVGTTSNGGTFQGNAQITGFAVDGNNVVAVGTITGLVNGTQGLASTFTAVVSPATTSTTTPAQVPGAQTATACQPVNLVLTPGNLNILGFVVTISNPMVLNVTAVPGTGNLSNLVCGAASLVNGGAAGQPLADRLNQILATLNGL